MASLTLIIIAWVGVGVITFYKPIYILPLFIFGNFIEPMRFFPELIEYKVATVAGMVVVICWLLHISIYRDVESSQSGQIKIVILFLLWALTSCLINKETSLSYFVFHLRSFLPYFFFIYMIKTKKQLFGILWIFIIFGLIASLYSVYCSRTGQGYMDRGIWRISGFFENPNVFGQNLIILVPLAISFIFYYASIVKRSFLLLCLAFFMVGILLSQSRMCFFALIPGVILITMSFFSREKKIIAFIVSIFFLLSIAYLMPGTSKYALWSRIRGVFQSESAESLDSGRTETTKAGIKMMKQHPLFGVGFGGFKPEYIDIAMKDPNINLVLNTAKDREDPQPLGPHNMLVEAGAYLGVGGLIIFLLVLYWGYRDIRYVEKRNIEINSFYFKVSASFLKIFIFETFIMGMVTQVLTMKIFWMIIPLTSVTKKLMINELINRKQTFK